MSIYKCTCNGHSLEVEIDKELDYVAFLFWERSSGGSVCLSWRLKRAWDILTKGRIVHEECLLSFKDSKKLCKEITRGMGK